MISSYKTIAENLILEIEPIKKSRFIAYLYKIESEQQALNYISQLKEKFPDANHHCWAYSLSKENKYRFSDDGEPSGSAGRPILSHILGQELFDVLIVVVRYFGGTKLGVGGLVRAYGQAAKEILSLVDIIKIEAQTRLQINFDYSQTANVDPVMNRYDVQIISQSYGSYIEVVVSIDVSIRGEFVDDITNLTKNNVEILELKD